MQLGLHCSVTPPCLFVELLSHKFMWFQAAEAALVELLGHTALFVWFQAAEAFHVRMFDDALVELLGHTTLFMWFHFQAAEAFLVRMFDDTLVELLGHSLVYVVSGSGSIPCAHV